MTTIFIPTTPQDGDTNDTLYHIGQHVRVSNGYTGRITRINGTFIWVAYDDGERGCVAAADIWFA